MTVAPTTRSRASLTWHSFENWVGTRGSAIALFALALGLYALQSVVLPAYPGRDMGRYVQAWVQYSYEDPVLPYVLRTRNPLSVLGVGIPLEFGGLATEVWLALLFAASVVAWAATALVFGPRAAALTGALLLVYPSYGILFHQLSSDALFAAGFAGWVLILSRSILRPSSWMYLALGAGVGLLMLIRPSNQVLLAFVLLPLVLRAPWGRRLTWMAAFFSASAIVIQGWRAFMSLRFGDATGIRPSVGVVVLAVALLAVVFLTPLWQRRLGTIAVPVLVAAVVVAGVRGQSPSEAARSLVSGASIDVFLFRAFQMDQIVRPDNGPASRELARAVSRELLTKEPYRSYGVDIDTVFSSGSDRIFADLTSLGGVDFRRVTREAILAHPAAFAEGIARTFWKLLSARVYAPETLAVPGDGPSTAPSGDETDDVIVVDGRELPRPSEGQPIPASRTGPAIWALYGEAREVWRSATEHPLVFDDPRDEQRYLALEEDSARLSERLPTRGVREGLIHRLNQTSRAFPALGLWLAVGLLAAAIRRPQRALVALAPTVAALAVIVGTGLVGMPVGEYAVPVAPAFIVLAAVGLVGAEPRGRSWRRATSSYA